jgi:hypothetical protein
VPGFWRLAEYLYLNMPGLSPAGWLPQGTVFFRMECIPHVGACLQAMAFFQALSSFGFGYISVAAVTAA